MFNEDTPVLPAHELDRARRKMTAANDGGSKIRRFFGWLVLSDSYLRSLSDERIQERAFTPGARTRFQAVQHACEDSFRGLCERADAESRRLGAGYRAHVQADVIKEVTSAGMSIETVTE